MLLSEMFGVERYVEFEVIGYVGRFILKEQYDGTERLWWRLKDIYVNADLDILYDIILKAPANIIHLPPPLTDEQREQLKAIWTLGGWWIAKDETGNVFAYDSKPQKIMICCHWNNDEDGECFTVTRELSVCNLVSWADPEPYDIAKALGVGE